MYLHWQEGSLPREPPGKPKLTETQEIVPSQAMCELCFCSVSKESAKDIFDTIEEILLKTSC